MTNIPSSKDKTEDTLNKDDINLNLLFNFLNRNKKKISIISFIFLVLTCLYSLTLKRIWSGEFQIVLNSSSPSDRSSLAEVLVENKSDLKTQVGILKSPSILIPIYEFVIANKNQDLANTKMPFNKWEKQLEIELEKKTSILNITYEDKDKEIILPVLKKISSAYQDYSQKNKKRAQQLTTNFLNDQISIYKKKSSNSLKIAQEYALDQDLIFFDSVNSNQMDTTTSNKIDVRQRFNKLTNQDGYELLRSSPGIIRSRINASNDIRRIEQQIKKIEGLGDDVEKLQYISSTIPGIRKEGLSEALSKLQQELAERYTKYKETDKGILTLIKKREVLINLIKTRVIGYLKAEKLEAEAIMEASMRPKGVLLKYKELARTASRDELTLISLEGQLRKIELEKAKLEDPWELITNPTLSKIPVGPERKKIALYGLFIGFLIGSGYVFLKEKKSDRIFDFESLNNCIDANLIGNINVNDLEASNSQFSYCSDFIKTKNWDKISFITIGDLDKETIINISNKLLPNKEDINLVFSRKELKSSSNADLKIIFISLGKVTFGELKEFKKYLKLYDLSVDGFVLLDNLL